MSLVTLNEVKSLCDISGSSYDNQISALISVVEGQVISITNNNFVSSSADDKEGIKLPIAMMINHLISGKDNISSETIGGYSVSYKDYPNFIYTLLNSFNRATFV